MRMTTAEYMRLDRIASQLEDAHDVTDSTGSQETKHALLTGAQELRELMRASSLFPAKEIDAGALQAFTQERLAANDAKEYGYFSIATYRSFQAQAQRLLNESQGQ